MTKRIRTNVSIDHVTRGPDGRATTYQGRVTRGKRTVASTPVMTDGCECLRAAEALERKYRATASR